LKEDIIANGIAYLDVLGLWTTSGLNVQVGRTLAPTKTFAAESGFPITITNYNMATAPALANLNMEAIRLFAKELSRLYCPSYDGRGFGRYVIIINEHAKHRLSTDPEFQTMMSRLQDAGL